MAYQSLEDRIVKNALRRRDGVTHPAGTARRTARARAGIRRLTRGAERAGTDEIERQSAKRVRAAAGTGKGGGTIMKAKQPAAVHGAEQNHRSRAAPQ